MNKFDHSLDSDNLYNWNLSNTDSEHSREDNDSISEYKQETKPEDFEIVKCDSRIVAL